MTKKRFATIFLFALFAIAAIILFQVKTPGHFVSPEGSPFKIEFDHPPDWNITFRSNSPDINCFQVTDTSYPTATLDLQKRYPYYRIPIIGVCVLQQRTDILEIEITESNIRDIILLPEDGVVTSIQKLEINEYKTWQVIVEPGAHPEETHELVMMQIEDDVYFFRLYTFYSRRHDAFGNGFDQMIKTVRKIQK